MIYLTEEPTISFLDISLEILDTKLMWLSREQKGKWFRSEEMDPLNPQRIPKKDLYTKEQRKKFKPTEACTIMFVDENRKANQVVNYLKNAFNRKLKRFHMMEIVYL